MSPNWCPFFQEYFQQLQTPTISWPWLRDEICKEYQKSFEDSHAEAERIYASQLRGKPNAIDLLLVGMVYTTHLWFAIGFATVCHMKKQSIP